MTTTTERYNGYANHATWCVNLWIDNTQETQEFWREHARQLKGYVRKDRRVRDGTWTAEEATRYLLADGLRERFESDNPLAGAADMWSDLMTHALGQVDWNEIAVNLLEE